MVATNTGIFLRGLKLFRESKTSQVLLVSKKKIRGSYAFFRDNKASIFPHSNNSNNSNKPRKNTSLLEGTALKCLLSRTARNARSTT